MRVKFTRYAGKYISISHSQGEPHGLLKVHQWEDRYNNLYERHCYNVEGMLGEVDTDLLSGNGYALTDRDVNGKRYILPVNKKCYVELNGEDL